MPVLDRSKVRPDVLKLIDEYMKAQAEALMKFLEKEGKTADFSAIWGKVMAGNERFFRREMSVSEIYNWLTKEEMLFLAKILRYAFEYAASVEQEKHPIPSDVIIDQTDAGGVPAEWQIVPVAADDRVLLYFHGGGMIVGSSNTHRLLTVRLGEETKMMVLSVDYRLAPEYTYPAQLEDCVKAYKWLLSLGVNPKGIVVAGDSAGGNLALTTLLKLKDEGVELPAGAVCLSPVTDWTSTDEAFFENAKTDPVLADVGVFWWGPAYLAGANPADPLVSPLFADLKGLPPILIQASTSEMLFSGCKRFAEKARAAGVDVRLETWDDMPHVFQSFGLHALPEAKQAIENIGKFVEKIVK
ncbi:MAG: alpha/beta hydrolase [Candidatus Freyarchaeota archaeon]|nr:alpha/beta hydrolase [Candidatus Jordarchaeia archaeon]